MSLIGGLSLYVAVVIPVVVHALGSKWPLRVFVPVSVFFGLMNLGPILKGLLEENPTSAYSTETVLDHL